MAEHAPVFTVDPDRSIRFLYRNWRGEIAMRHVHPVAGGLTLEINWASTPHHPEEQWLFDAWDIDKGAYRTFALRDVLAHEGGRADG